MEAVIEFGGRLGWVRLTSVCVEVSLIFVLVCKVLFVCFYLFNYSSPPSWSQCASTPRMKTYRKE